MYITKRYLQRAYTLIEIMVALAVFAILSSIVSMSLSNTVRSYQSQNEHHNKLLELQRIFTMLQHDIQQIVPRGIYAETGAIQPPVYFDNLKGNNYFEFTRGGLVNPQSLQQRSNLQRMAYYWQDNKLWRLHWQQLDREHQEQPAPQIVADNVLYVKWDFYDEDNQQYSLWSPTSQWQNRLPAAIGITLNINGWGEVQRLFVLPENIAE